MHITLSLSLSFSTQLSVKLFGILVGLYVSAPILHNLMSIYVPKYVLCVPTRSCQLQEVYFLLCMYFIDGPNRNEYQGYLLGHKGGRCVRLITLPPSCTKRLEILKASNSCSTKGLPMPVMG
jgi:hypothetical protein